MNLVESVNNVGELFVKRAQVNSQKTAYLRKKEGSWISTKWQNFEQEVFEVARALQEAGVGRGDRVAILSQTRPEWSIADIAILSLGAVTVPIYSSVTSDEVFYILKDSLAKVIVVEDSVQREKVRPLLKQLENLKLGVTFEAAGDDDFKAFRVWVKAPGQLSLEAWRENTRSFGKDTLATLVYTSGTTGLPKGAELAHENFLAMIAASDQALEIGEDDLTLLFLPTAHIMGRSEQMLMLGVGWTTAFAESMAGLMDNMAELKPTILVSVPRIYEKFYAAIQSKFTAGPSRNLWIFETALAIGRRYSQCLQRGERPSWLLQKQYKLADRVVFSKVREKFGGRLRFTISGGAPLSREIAEFFHACGIMILEAYGLTETTGPISSNRVGEFRFGTVGKLLNGTEVKLAADGEILLKGPMIFKGYNGKPEMTAEALHDGFFATGDVGHIDEQGFLKITDRKKDIIITAGGKNIAPQKIENLFKSDSLFANVIVFGDREKYLVMLLCLNLAELRKAFQKTGLNFSGLEDALKVDDIKKLIKIRVDKINAGLASYEKIKKYHILPRDLSLEAGELTPSLKVKRKFCAQKYADLIKSLYV